MSTIRPNETWGESYFSTIDGFLEDEWPFAALEIELRKEDVPSDDKPVPDNPAESWEYTVYYWVKKQGRSHEVSEHPIAQLNNNVEDLEAAERVIKRQVGNIAARLERRYHVSIALRLLDGPTRFVDQDFIKELGASPTAKICYITTRASVRTKRPYEAPPLQLLDSAQ